MNNRIKWLSFIGGVGGLVLSPLVMAYNSNDYYCYRMPAYPYRYCTQNPQDDFPYQQQYFYGNAQANFPYNSPYQPYNGGNFPYNYPNYNYYGYEFNNAPNGYYNQGYNYQNSNPNPIEPEERFPDMPSDAPQ